MPASPASSTTSSSSSSSSYTSSSSVLSTPLSHVVSPHRDNVSQSQPRSGTPVIGDALLWDIDGKQIRGVRIICERGGYIADITDVLVAQTKQYLYLVIHVGKNGADLSLDASEVLEEFRPLLSAADARADVVSVSAPCPHLDGTCLQSMVETVNVGVEELAEGQVCHDGISHDGNFHHQDNNISE